ncbi:unnamed protein product [Rotaria sordida]|uniref:HTH CENPB-type domain-containing protein n=1 Tax=Rotaria sordida TaxID=392033 RepID=A0A814RID8_9BILA|nr:unnamed protein product [Rotaria sordida]CAF1204613.1 unnamed protein product [Rotaria sordida]CAF1479359.1 unnamed protein product [Rotaria sordida]
MTSCHELTLHEKVQLIYDNRDGNGLSQRKLAEKYNISLGSVSNILKRKTEYLKDYETNQNQTVKRKSRDVNVQTLDEQVSEWFVQQRAKGIPISGPILQEKARDIAESLGDQFASFKGSNGWLEKFRARHNISHYVISGESSSVDVQTVDDWIQRSSKITHGYDAKNIFNCDETILFFKTMPDDSLTFDQEECKGADIVTVTGDEQCEELEKLDDLLQHVTIGGQTMKASDFIELDKDIPPFNIWFDNCERLMASDLIEFNDDDEIDDEDDRITTESSQKYRKQWK